MSPDGKLIASCGRFGEIHLFTAKSKEWITTLKMNGACNSLTFTSDGKKMYSFGGNYCIILNCTICLILRVKYTFHYYLSNYDVFC